VIPNPIDLKREYLAKAAANSTCKRRQVGALALNADGYALGSGFNEIVNGSECLRCPLSQEECPQTTAYDNPSTYCPAMHAEEIAFFNAGDRWTEVRHMVVSSEPCTRCADFLRRLGILVEVVEITTI
jgi:deoxycytidylate deaminase